MSEIARWSYRSVMTVRPFVSRDEWNGVTTYGPEYSVACDWIAAADQMRDARGQEFVSRYQVFHEARSPEGLPVRVPAMLDIIRLDASPEEQEVRDTLAWNMAAFDDIPDYKTVT